MSYVGVPPFGQTVRTITEVTATAGQTVFTPSGGYLPGYIDVTLNGAALTSADFTATNGTTVTLTVAAAVGDEFRCVAYWPVSLVDTYRKGETDSLLAAKVNKAGDTMTGVLTSTGFRSDGSGALGGGFDGTTGAGNFGVRVRAKTDNSVAILQFTDTAATAQWGVLNSYSNGAITMPYQPAFRVGKSNGNWTGQCVFNDVFINIGGGYNSSTGRFTAPVSGTYFVTMDAICNDNNSQNYLVFDLKLNGSTFNSVYQYADAASRHYQYNTSAVVYMNAGDYLTVVGAIGEFYGLNSAHTHFSGHLIG